MKIEIDDRDEFIREVAAAVMRDSALDICERVDAAVAAEISKALNERAHQLAVEELRPRIREVLDGVWVESDSYGSERRYSLKEMIGRYFKPDRARYSSDRSWMGELVEKRVAEIMKDELQPEINAAKKCLREKLDTILGEKVALAVREAIGLR